MNRISKVKTYILFILIDAISLYLFLKNLVFSLIYLGVSILLLIIIARALNLRSDEIKYRYDSLDYVKTYIASLAIHKDPKKAYELNLDKLEKISFNHSFEEVKENDSLLDELMLEEFSDVLKASFRNEVRYGYLDSIEEIISKKQKKLEKDIFLKSQNYFVFYSLILLVFPFISLLLKDLITSLNINFFLIPTLGIYLLPLILIIVSLGDFKNVFKIKRKNK